MPIDHEISIDKYFENTYLSLSEIPFTNIQEFNTISEYNTTKKYCNEHNIDICIVAYLNQPNLISFNPTNWGSCKFYVSKKYTKHGCTFKIFLGQS